MAMPLAPSDATIHQIRATILDLTPTVWRRFQVESDTTLYRLHKVLQIVMGWQDYHLHQFTANGIEYGEPDPDYELEFRSTRTTRLGQIAPTVGSRFLYVYDFGDHWQHEILVEEIVSPEQGMRYPVCLAGERACPREDAGGVHGYADLLSIRQDPRHEEYEETMMWLGEDFDPDAFDVGAVNRHLRRVRPISRGQPRDDPGLEKPEMPREIAPRIVVDPKVRSGNPVIRGTRVPVQLVIAKLGAGMTTEEVAGKYGITVEDVRAALSYAARILAGNEGSKSSV
jgi:uncharacterized protein (DUF433 family)